MSGSIAIIDYGVGNLFSLQSSLASLGFDTEVTGDPEALAVAGRIILPGVGAFGDAMDKLCAKGLDEVVHRQAKAGKPLLGICLGMQLLFERSLEFGEHAGLGLVPGEICPLADDLAELGLQYKVPHMGWNPLHVLQLQSPLMRYTKEGDSVYFVHSFYAKKCESSTVAEAEYGVMVPAAVQCGSVFGTQFHPEKSGEAGLRILKAFAEG